MVTVVAVVVEAVTNTSNKDGMMAREGEGEAAVIEAAVEDFESSIVTLFETAGSTSVVKSTDVEYSVEAVAAKVEVMTNRAGVVVGEAANVVASLVDSSFVIIGEVEDDPDVITTVGISTSVAAVVNS